MKRSMLVAVMVAVVGTVMSLPGMAQAPGGQARGGGPGRFGNRLDVRNMERPIEAHDSVWIEALTMMEVRDLIKEGKTTALILTGGIEENGPYLVTGKHNYALPTEKRAGSANSRSNQCERRSSDGCNSGLLPDVGHACLSIVLIQGAPNEQ